MYPVDILALVQQEQCKDRLWEAEQWRLQKAAKQTQERKRNVIQSAMLRLRLPIGRQVERTRLVAGRQLHEVGQR